MNNNNSIFQEYDMRKIGITILLFIGIVGGIFAGITLLQDRVDIRNQAADSCPIGSEKTVKCTFTVESSTPFTYVVTVTNGAGGSVTAGGSMDPSEPSTTITEELTIVHSGTYKCHVSVTTKVTNSCGTKEASDEGEDTIACTPDDDPPGPPTNTPSPTPDRDQSPACSDCSRVEVKLDFEEPKGQSKPTLTPPNVYKDDLKIGRLTIEFINPSECGVSMSCADIKKIEFRAYNNDSCSGQPDLTPIPLNSEGDDEYGRYGSSIKCSDAVISPGNNPYNEGALFRLHQARGANCRCYKVNVEFTKDAEEKPVCPNMPKENVCCSSVCVPPEIIDDPDDPNDGCPGDPDGPRPNDNPKCYFVPQTSCPRINAETHFKSYTGGAGSGGYLGYDDDFAGAPDGKDQRVLNEEDHFYNYKDGGSYDVKLICDNGQTCKKRLRMTCNDGSPGGPGNGNPPPPPPACVLPEISGICIDQP